MMLSITIKLCIRLPIVWPSKSTFWSKSCTFKFWRSNKFPLTIHSQVEGVTRFQNIGLTNMVCQTKALKINTISLPPNDKCHVLKFSMFSKFSWAITFKHGKCVNHPTFVKCKLVILLALWKDTSTTHELATMAWRSYTRWVCWHNSRYHCIFHMIFFHECVDLHNCKVTTFFIRNDK